MNKLRSYSQREKVKHFMAFTHISDERLAIFCLQSCDWKLDRASDNYFLNPDYYQRHPYCSQQQQQHYNTSSHQPPSSIHSLGGVLPSSAAQMSASAHSVDLRRLELLYQHYRDPDDMDKISVDGVTRFLEDLRLNPEDRFVLILAWRFRAQVQCEFTRKEFIQGMHSLCCDSIDRLRALAPHLEAEVVGDTQQFKHLYQFTFNYAKSPGQRGLDLGAALAYWRILLADKFPLLDTWCQFVQKQHTHDISRDTWNLLLDFALSSHIHNLAEYNEHEAWPVLIDEFVDYVRHNLSE